MNNKCKYLFGCEENIKSKGFCVKHYNNYHRKTRRSGIFKWDDISRLMEKIEPLSDEEREFLTIQSIKSKHLEWDIKHDNVVSKGVSARHLAKKIKYIKFNEGTIWN